MDPTGPQHRRLRVHAVFVALCETAAARGLQVGIDVGAIPRGPKGQHYRTVGPVVVGIPERPQLITEHLLDGEWIDAAAARALNRVLNLG